MDTTRDIMFRGYLLNDASIRDSIDADTGIGKGISGCVVDTWDDSDKDVIQFMEKRSLQDGMDVGDVFLGAGRLRMAGTLYGKTRALLFDAYLELRAILSPVLAQRESPADKGYLPLYFSIPTNNVDDTVVADSGGQTLGYPAGARDLRYLVMPKGKQLVWQRDSQGGEDSGALAIPWQATFIMKDPTLMAETPQDYDLSAGGSLAGNFVNRGTYIATMNMLMVVGSGAGTIAVAAGGSTFTITVPASSGNRTIRYKGIDKILTVEEGGIEANRLDWLPGVASMSHPLIPAGVSAWTVTFTTVTPQAGSHMWFWESFA